MSIDAAIAVARRRKIEHGGEIDHVCRKFEQRREHSRVSVPHCALYTSYTTMPSFEIRTYSLACRIVFLFPSVNFTEFLYFPINYF